MNAWILTPNNSLSVFTSFLPLPSLSFSPFLPSFLPLSFCFPSQTLLIPSPLMLQCFSRAHGNFMVPWVQRLLTHWRPVTWNQMIYFFPLPFKEVCCNFCNRSKVISSYSNVCRAQEFFEGLRVNLRLSSDHSVDGNESCVQGNVVTY